MKLQDLISFNTNYTRSINLERDADSFAIARSYIPTSRTLSTLSRIADSLNREDTPRSFALIGPYGSGKSAFAVFLAHLLGPVDGEGTKAAWQVLHKTDQRLYDKFSFHTYRTFGYLPVLITGTPEPLANRFVESLYKAAKTYWKKMRGPNHSIVKELDQCAGKQVSIKRILTLISQLQDAVSKSGRGILIVFDELGKFLEYEARHYEANDIYLLQALAEHAYKGNEANLIVAVLMHQGFEQYARGLGETLRNEWGKVQGRYENIPFLESTEQTLRIVANAFQHELDKNQQMEIAKKCSPITAVLEKQNALPGIMAGEEASDLFRRCYPLHPVASLVLPILCQKLAQNERTLFSYLGSNEPHGLRDCIRKLDNVGDFVSLWEIYEYFIRNQPAVLSDPSTHRRWAEVVTALERLGDAPSEEIELVKTIGLLNIIGAHGGLKASQTIVELCLPDKENAQQALNALIQKSIIQFRKYSSEYRVWQGSDFDLETAVQDELNQVSHFSLPESLNDRKALPPIVARRHTIETGALRYFQSCFVDPVSYTKEAGHSSMQRIIFCLVESRDDKEIFHQDIIGYFSDQDVVVLCHNGDQLREATAEVLALQRVQTNCPELNTDPVAMREYKDRRAAAEQHEDELLAAFIETPEIGEWYWKQTKFSVGNKRNLQQELSRILDTVYHAAPVFKNELINREKPSSQATAARNKLVAGLLHNVDKEDLGIEKYPAEKGIYLALLKATGLHKEIEGKWQLVSPGKDENLFNIYPVWEKITDFLEKTENKPQSFAELGPDLKAPPYGIKEGVLPILYATAFLCYQHELALYEDNVYTPYFTDQHLERFVKRPDYFTVQRFRISGMRATIFKQYVKALYGDTEQSKSLLSIVKPLAKFMAELPEYSKCTKNMSPIPQKVRKAFELAKTPEEVLFNILPEACGISAIDPNEVVEDNLKGFSAALMDALRELKYAYPNLLTDLTNNITQALLPHNRIELSIGELRQKLLGRFDGLSQYTVDVKGLRAFLLHICQIGESDERWLESLLLFLANKPARNWSDIDRDGVDLKLAKYSRRLLDLRSLQVAHEKQATRNKDFDIILLKAMRHGKTENERAVCIDSASKEKIAQIKNKINGSIGKLDPELKLAILAELVDDCLEDSRMKTSGNIDEVAKRAENE
jgi:hypothetical protein